MTVTNHLLRQWRHSQEPKVTLTALSDDVGVTPSHLCEIERGNNNPSLDLAVRLSKRTGLPVECFVAQEHA